MVIGLDTPVSQMLSETIGQFIKVDFIILNDRFEAQLEAVVRTPQYIFVNLMDVSQPAEVAIIVREYFPESILVGLHNYLSPSLIEHTLSQGYDRYISVFNLPEELPKLLQPTLSSS